MRAPIGRPASISARICAKVAGAAWIETKLWVRSSALSKYHGMFAPAGVGVSQASVRPSSALTILHCVHVLNDQKKCETLLDVAAQHQFDASCACMVKLSCLVVNSEPHHWNSLSVAVYGIALALTMSSMVMALILFRGHRADVA